MDRFSFKKKFDQTLWGDDDAPPLSFKPMRIARLIVAVVRDVGEGDLNLRATSLVYTTLLSLAPLLALCFSVLKGFGVQDQIEPFLRNFLEPLGDGGELASRLVGFVNNIQVGVLGVIGLAFLMYSIISLLQQVEAAFNAIWRVPAARNWSTRLRDYLSILLIGPLFLFLSTGMSTALHNAEFMKRWLGVDLVGGAIEWLFTIVPYILFVSAFTILYMFMPNTRVRAVPALIAGILTGVVWKFLGWIFGLFIAGSANYAAIYSVFAALVLFIIWLYIGWMIVLINACVAYYLQNPSNQPMSRKFRRLSTRLREKLALQICAEVGAAFYKHEDVGPDVSDLSARLMLPALVIENVTEDLMQAGVITMAYVPSPHFVPQIPFDITSVAAVLKLLRATEESGFMRVSRLKAAAIVENVMNRAEAAEHDALGQITLKQLSMEGAEA